MVSTPIKDEGLVGKLYPRSEFRDHSRQFFGDSLMICPPEKKKQSGGFWIPICLVHVVLSKWTVSMTIFPPEWRVSRAATVWVRFALVSQPFAKVPIPDRPTIFESGEGFYIITVECAWWMMCCLNVTFSVQACTMQQSTTRICFHRHRISSTWKVDSWPSDPEWMQPLRTFSQKLTVTQRNSTSINDKNKQHADFPAPSTNFPK